jgi:hypothetical protein
MHGTTVEKKRTKVCTMMKVKVKVKVKVKAKVKQSLYRSRQALRIPQG